MKRNGRKKSAREGIRRTRTNMTKRNATNQKSIVESIIVINRIARNIAKERGKTEAMKGYLTIHPFL